MAKDMFEGEIFLADEKVKDEDKCQLRGCEAKVDKDKNPHHKFCCRRHFYLDHHRKFGHSDQWKRAAYQALAVVAAAEATGVEGAKVEETEEESEKRFFVTMVVILVFAFVGVYNVFQKLKQFFEFVFGVISDKRNVVKNNEVVENNQVHVETYSSRSHGVAVCADAGVGSTMAIPDRRDASAGSSENDQSPKSVQATDGPQWEIEYCQHEHVSWRGTNANVWFWKCQRCGKAESQSKTAHPDRPDPMKSSKKPFKIRQETIARQYARRIIAREIEEKIVQTPLTHAPATNCPDFRRVKKNEDGAYDHRSQFDHRD